jgi:hypothetical protein
VSGALISPIVNPALVHLGVPPIAEPAINRLSAGAGAAIGGRVSVAVHHAWAAFDESRRRATAKGKLRYLADSAVRIPDLEVGMRLRQRLVERMKDFEAVGVLTIAQIETKIFKPGHRSSLL